MKKIISYIYKKCWDIIANPNANLSRKIRKMKIYKTHRELT